MTMINSQFRFWRKKPMCLILFSISPDPEHTLVVAANRDEFYGRATQRPAYWPGEAHILGGRDLQAGGTWLGVTHTGRFAAVTNFRETPVEPVPPRSRGALTADFLRSNESCLDYIERLKPIAAEFRGFNLLLNDGLATYYYSNRHSAYSNRHSVDPDPAAGSATLPGGTSPRRLAPGFYGLSNQLLDCDWPKVSSGRAQLQALAPAGFPAQALFELLADRGDQTPFSARFIQQSESYGTSASTVVKIKAQQVYFEERAFLPMGVAGERNVFDFAVMPLAVT
jgi:uncharacterized protein with NRDE domain